MPRQKKPEKTKRNNPASAKASDDDDHAHLDDLTHVTKELFEALARKLAQLNPIDYSAICAAYGLDAAIARAPELFSANPQALAATCAEARRTLSWLLERDLAHQLRSADDHRSRHLRLAQQIVRGQLLLSLHSAQAGPETRKGTSNPDNLSIGRAAEPQTIPIYFFGYRSKQMD